MDGRGRPRRERAVETASGTSGRGAAGMIKQAWDRLRNRCTTCATTTLIFGGAVGGLIVAGLLLASGAYGLAWTNTEGFCISCHDSGIGISACGPERSRAGTSDNRNSAIFSAEDFCPRM